MGWTQEDITKVYDIVRETARSLCTAGKSPGAIKSEILSNIK